jgi:hypothetical protein
LYEYFGGLLGCSEQGGSDYAAYDGANSMYSVHKFMDLSAAEVGYFITQVALSAASFGVAEADLTVVGTALNTLFNEECSPATVVQPSQPAALQAICIGDGCVQATVNATCGAYSKAVEPATASSSSAAATGSSTGTMTESSSASATGSATGSATPTVSGNAGVVNKVSYAAAAGLMGAAFFL